MAMIRLELGDSLTILPTLAEASVDAVVTDPPYELGFMGKSWDATGIAYNVDLWRRVLRVLKPGGHLLAFSGSRTYHRMTCAIEDAGFEIRDQIMWVYGSGLPKSLDVSKAIDKAAGAERKVVGRNPNSRENCTKENTLYESGTVGKTDYITAPATDAARQWSGWGTALKPAHEPIVLARKPLIGTVAENVLAHGTGAINVDGCGVPAEKPTGWGGGGSALYEGGLSREGGEARLQGAGRWPANFIHDGSEEVVGLFPGEADSSAARFFYCAKASKADRDEGMEGFQIKKAGGMQGRNDGTLGSITMRANHHPTVKPTALMRYLCKLVTPPGGVVLDPFLGSGSTGKAAVLEGFDFIGIEREAEYHAIATARIKHAGAVKADEPVGLIQEDLL